MALNRKVYKWFYDHVHCHFYDLIVKWCFWPFGGERRCRKELVTPIDFSPGEKILDMCCGTGGATFVIANKAGKECEIIGIDLSSGQIKIAERKKQSADIKFIEGDATNTGFEQRYFDKVSITHALHEMPREIRLNVLNEAKRVLKERGKVIILELDNPQSFFVRLFIGCWFFYWLPFNFETPTRRDMIKCGLTNEVKGVGFKEVRKTSKYQGVFQIIEAEK